MCGSDRFDGDVSQQIDVEVVAVVGGDFEDDGHARGKKKRLNLTRNFLHFSLSHLKRDDDIAFPTLEKMGEENKTVGTK